MQTFEKAAVPQLPTAHNDIDAHTPAATTRSSAHAFFWRVLITAAIISITGNTTAAVLHSSGRCWLAVPVAVVPPIALITAVHGVAVLSRAHGPDRLLRMIAIGTTVLIASSAFRLSFTALRLSPLSRGF
ncbi:hypothetical protein [Nocardia sp. NPDC004860]|uniref:hypothetical protein n=1 Tax=Nocardia sp. NPDC004860 TaxID=3154557 RepID=UPI0033B8157A